MLPILSQTVPLQFDTAYSPYAASDWRAAFADVADHGLTGVELAIAYPEEVDTGAVLAEAGRHGLAITTISTGQICGREGCFLTAANAGSRERAAAVLRDHIRLSVRLGRPHVTVGLLRGGFGDNAGGNELLSEMLHPLCKMAESEGVRLQIEPINHQETAMLNSTQQTLDFMRGMGNPAALGILYDTYHSDIEDEDPLSAAKSALPYITNVHFSDRDRFLPGEKGIDFSALYALLNANGYRYAYALETKCLPTQEHVLAHYGESIKNVIKIS